MLLPEKYSDAFSTYLSRKKPDAAKQLQSSSANREPRHVRFSESGGSGTSSSCNSPRAVLPIFSFALASPGSGSESAAAKQRIYTAESPPAAILGQRNEVKSGREKSVSSAKKDDSKKNVTKESAKMIKRM